MQRRAILATAGLLAAASMGVYAWHAMQSAQYTNYPLRQGPVLMFGDSLVEGVGASEGRALPALIGEKLGEPVANFGVSGDTTEKALARIDAPLALHPRIALVLLGGNDYLQRVPKEQTFRNLRTIIERFQKDGSMTVLLGVRGGILKDNFSADFERLARDTGSAYVPDVLSGLLGEKKYMYNEVHPNDAGYAIIAGRILQVLGPIVR